MAYELAKMALARLCVMPMSYDSVAGTTSGEGLTEYMVAAAMSGLPRTKELVLRAKWGGDDKALTALCYEICKGLPQEWGLSQQEKETLVGISVSDSFSELCTSCLGRGTRLKGEVVEDCPQCEGTGRGGGQMHQRLDNPYKGYALSIMRDIDEWDNDGLRHVTKRLFAYKQS